MELMEILANNLVIPKVDQWMPTQEDAILKHCRNAIVLPVSKFFNMEDCKMLDSFILTPKRCYYSPDVRNHICTYINYFEKFYDREHELLFYTYRMKHLIDLGHLNESGVKIRDYSLQDFYNDIKTYILSPSMYDKVWKMVEDNYYLDLIYRNKNNEGLQYNNNHGKYFMEMCIFMNMLIPLIMHFIYRNKINDTNTSHEIIFTIYNWLFDIYLDRDRMAKRGLQPADMFAKLYETARTTMEAHYKANKMLWSISEIRGFSPCINTNDSINTVIMQVIPKYTFNGNVINYNISGVRNNPKFSIDIQYEFDFSSLSSSKRDGEDNTSQFDKFEAHLIKTDESLLLQNNFRAEKTMKSIVNFYGPFEQSEIDFYRKALIANGRPIVNIFQQKLVFDMFYKFFGDPMSIQSINSDQYVIMVIAAKRILLSDNMKLLPYIIGGNIIQIASRTSLSKKEDAKFQQSEYYNDLYAKYNGDEKKMKQIKALIATILSSKFRIIDLDPEINGTEIKMESDIIMTEVSRFVLQI